MKNSKLKVSIPEPCHENWDKMTTSAKGKFCASCSKEVTDFTDYSDGQIVDFFTRNKGNVCGRFSQKQLNKSMPIHLPPQASNFRTASLVLSGLLASGAAIGQDPLPASPTQHVTKGDVVVDQAYLTDSPLHRIQGKILDINNEKAISFPIIKVKGLDHLTYGDVEGNFTLELEEKFLNEEVLFLEIEAREYDLLNYAIIVDDISSFPTIIKMRKSVTCDQKSPEENYNLAYTGYIVADIKEESTFSKLKNKLYNIFSSDKEENLTPLGEPTIKIEEEVVIPPPPPTSEVVYMGGIRAIETPVEESPIDETTVVITEDINPPPVPDIEIGWRINNVFPNPTAHSINIQINSFKSKNLDIQIVNQSGQLIHQQSNFISKGEDQVQINLSKILTENGLYIINVSDDKGTRSTHKIIFERDLRP